MFYILLDALSSLYLRFNRDLVYIEYIYLTYLRLNLSVCLIQLTQNVLKIIIGHSTVHTNIKFIFYTKTIDDFCAVCGKLLQKA